MGPRRALQRLRGRVRDESGFTLIELLAVIVIIGILAAIALPSFLGHRDKGYDADAKSNARNLVSHVESCFATQQNYNLCNTSATLNPLDIDYGSAVGQVEITGTTATSYEITAHSKATGGGAHNFVIAKNVSGVSSRTCTPTGQGGCPDSGSW
jgi:type IV pilus assembly protein PilA